MKPIILHPNQFTETDIVSIKTKNKIWQTKDIYELQVSELIRVRNPGLTDDGIKLLAKKEIGEDKTGLKGAWVYFPWNGCLLHCLGEEELFELRTNRNRNLITRAEQAKLNESVIAIAGMSVGSGIALSQIYSGQSRTIKIADFDTIETTNLNRLKVPLSSIGDSKIDTASRQIYDINPFADVIAFPEGIDSGNIDSFFDSPKTNIVIDEIDNFKMKVHLRIKAKEYKIPLLMFTSLGDNILVDVERYDEDEDLALFNGQINEVIDEIDAVKSITKEDEKRYAVQLISDKYVPTKALNSLLEIGKTISGRPQLYSTIAIDGGLATYLSRKIILGEEVPSGRYFVKLSQIFNFASDEFDETNDRRETLRRIIGNG